MRLVNLTPHAIVVFDGDRALATFPPSGRFARLRESHRLSAPLAASGVEIPTVDVAYEEMVDDLPDQVEGTAYIVSRVLAAAVERDDLYFPFDEVRDVDGRIVGCRALGRFTANGIPDA